MVNQQLLNYIKQQLQQGIPSDEIKKSLITNGWKEVDVIEAFTALTPEISTIQVSTPPISVIPQPETVPSKKKKWIKSIVITIVSLVVLNYAFFYLPHVLNLFTKDIPPVEYSDLKLEKVVVNDNDNAYFDLQKIENVLYYPDEASTTISNMATGKEWDNKLAEDLISRNSQTFEYLNQALNKPTLQYPQYTDPETFSVNTLSVPLNLYRKIARLESIKILSLLRQNKNEESINEAFLLLSFGQKIENAQGDILNYLIGILIKNLGIEDIQKIISTSTFTSEKLIQYSDNLNNYKNDKENFTVALKMENYYLINNLTNLNKDINSGMKNTEIPFSSRRTQANAFYYFKLEKTKKMVIENTRNKIAFLDEPLSKVLPENNQSTSSIGKEKKFSILSFVKLYFMENSIGILLVNITSEHYSATRRKSVELPINATQLILSLKAFKNDNGILPNTLNDLVPNYISAIPIDPYDKNPLRYSKEKKIIYSVGTSTEDVGGSDGASWQTMKNPTFKFDF